MKETSDATPRSIEALTFDKLLEVSSVMRDSVRYGKNCSVRTVEVGDDKDIFKFPAKVDAYLLVICSDGLIELSYNLFQVSLEPGSMFLYQPGMIMRLNAIKPGRVSIVAFTRDFIDELGIKFDNVPLQYRIVHERQAFTLDRKVASDMTAMLEAIERMIGLDADNLYYHETVKAAFRTFLYRTLYELSSLYGAQADVDTVMTHDHAHFDRFIRLLQENFQKEHSIKYYAERMHLSPKYMSLMIKKVSGRLATQWIDDYVILEAKSLIKYSTMSIQEVAYTLNFPNQSFFGKYFKRHTGLSPKAYRRQP